MLFAATDSSQYKDSIWTIADQCVFEGGPAVLKAQAFLITDSLALISYNWPDSCAVGEGSSKMGNPNPQPVMVEPELLADYQLIPNLFNGNRTAQVTLGIEETGQVRIYDIAGRLVGEFGVNEGVNNIDITKSITGTGIYIYKIFVNNDLKRTDKLVVVE